MIIIHYYVRMTFPPTAGWQQVATGEYLSCVTTCHCIVQSQSNTGSLLCNKILLNGFRQLCWRIFQECFFSFIEKLRVHYHYHILVSPTAHDSAQLSPHPGGFFSPGQPLPPGESTAYTCDGHVIKIVTFESVGGKYKQEMDEISLQLVGQRLFLSGPLYGCP